MNTLMEQELRMDAKPLSRRQAQTLELIARSILTDGVAPTQQELADAMGNSKTTVYELVEALENKGYVKRHTYIARGVELTAAARTWVNQRFVLTPKSCA